MDTLYTVWDNTTHYKTKSVHFLGPMNSATKNWVWELGSGCGFTSIRSSLIGVWEYCVRSVARSGVFRNVGVGIRNPL